MNLLLQFKALQPGCGCVFIKSLAPSRGETMNSSRVSIPALFYHNRKKKCGALDQQQLFKLADIQTNRLFF